MVIDAMEQPLYCDELTEMNKSKIYFTGLAVLAAIIIFIWSRWGVAGDWDKLSDVAVEFHGLFFDYILVGIIYLFYDRQKARVDADSKKKADIERWEEEIDDDRYLNTKEAASRVLGALRRLKKAGASKIDIEGCRFHGLHVRAMNFPELVNGNADFSEMTLEGVDIEDSHLDGASFRETDIAACSFKDSHFSSSFQLATLYSVTMDDTTWRASNFHQADLTQVTFKNADLGEVDFEGASLVDVIFTGAKNLSVDQLLKANKIVDPIDLPHGFLSKIAEKNPAILTEAGQGNGRGSIPMF
jgi:uncharacterized protein YjbI with pentapeptide repeats